MYILQALQSPRHEVQGPKPANLCRESSFRIGFVWLWLTYLYYRPKSQNRVPQYLAHIFHRPTMEQKLYSSNLQMFDLIKNIPEYPNKNFIVQLSNVFLNQKPSIIFRTRSLGHQEPFLVASEEGW